MQANRMGSETFKELKEKIKLLNADQHPCRIRDCEYNKDGVCTEAGELGDPLPCQQEG